MATYLEDRYGGTVRGVIAALMLAIGTLAILAGQLIAGAAVLEVVAGLPKWQGVAIGGVAMTVYFTAGGLLSSAWVNAVQLAVLFGGFPDRHADGAGAAWAASTASPQRPACPATYFDPLYSAGAFSGWTMLLLLGTRLRGLARPRSEGLRRRKRAGRAHRRWRAGDCAAGVLVPAGPARAWPRACTIPASTSTNVVLPTVMLTRLAGAGLAHWRWPPIFSAEVSTCDAILFMLSTSMSQDRLSAIHQPRGAPDEVLRVAARLAAVTAGVLLAMFVAVQLSTVVDALRIFYSLLIATLFVPVAGGLLWPSAPASREAMAAIVGGMAALLAVQFGTNRTGWWDPGLWGLIGSAVGFVVMLPRLHGNNTRNNVSFSSGHGRPSSHA